MPGLRKDDKENVRAEWQAAKSPTTRKSRKNRHISSSTVFGFACQVPISGVILCVGNSHLPDAEREE